MTFAWPHLLWLLFLPALLLGWELTHRRRSAAISRPKILRAEAGAHSLTLSATGTSAASPRSRPRYWLAAGLALAIAALARPQYGKLEEPVFDQSREILVAIDLSRSMLAPDVKPSRLERAKLLIQSLLEKLEGERVGLVVFAGTSFLQSPLSADYEILREFLPALGPEFLPQGGSNYGALLDASLQAFSSSASADRFLIILSDGEATDEDWKSRIEKLKEKNIRVIGLGIGTAGGAMIPDGADGFIKDERGAVVLSKLESGTLQELSTATGGAYRDASGWLDLASLVKETVEAGRKGQFLEKNTVRLAERFQWPLALGLWCLLVSFYIEFPVRPRPREIKLTSSPRSAMPAAKAQAATVSALLLLALLLPREAFAISPAKPTPGAAPTLVPAPATPGLPATTPTTVTPPPPSAALAKIVGRLATTDDRTARDWAELGRETVTWGSKLQSEQQAIPDGPVRDAIAAVDLGAKLDPKTADWPKLRKELEDLLKKSEEQKQQQQDQDNKDQQDQKDQQDKKQQDKDQKNQDQKKSDQQKQDKDQQQKSEQEKSDEQKKQDKDQQQQQDKDDQQKQGDSAFGDMKKNEQPPPPPPDPGTQKVGGNPEKKPADQQQADDPSLALPLQKLEQLRNQDSPARLFQMMEGERKAAPATKGKDW